MRKLFLLRHFVMITGILLPNLLFSQKSSFDIVDYQHPSGFEIQNKDGMRVFIKDNKQTGGYCMIVLFESKEAALKIEDDFRNAWSYIVEKAYKGPGKPISEQKAAAEEGWNVMSGSALLKVDQVEVPALLTVLSGKERTISIFSLMNGEEFYNEFDQFLEGIDINKKELERLSGKSDLKKTESNKPGIPADKSGQMSYGNFIFSLPEGWVKLPESGFLEIVPQPVREMEVFSIILLPGKISGASLQQELASCWDEFAGILKAEKLREVSGGHYNEDEVSTTYAGFEYIAGHGALRTGTDFFVHAYIFRAKERIERVVVLSKEAGLDAVWNNMDPTRHHYPYYVAVTDFIFNLRFANISSPELPEASWKGRDINGVWSGIGFIGGKLRTTYTIFFSNGQVFYGSNFPVAGLYRLNTYAEKERTKRSWGTYSFRNGTGKMNMPSGSFPIRLEGDRLIMAPISEEHSFIRMPAIDDIRLNGTWTVSDEHEKRVSVTFTPDGSFTDKGALRILDHTVHYIYSIADGGGSGKYFIKDHTIVFTYNDGRILQIAFPGMQYVQGNQSPKELVLSFYNDVLIRE